MSDDPFDDSFDEEIAAEEKKEEKPTIDELKERLKNRRNQDRQARLGNMRKGKGDSGPMTRIYYCENRDCINIMTAGQQKVCSSCKCFVYCSQACQLQDWNEVHKTICGKNAGEEGEKLRNLYQQADEGAAKIEAACCHGNHVTVLHEKPTPGFNPPACIFSTIAKKSNVLHYSDYCRSPSSGGGGQIFTTAAMDTLGDFSKKIAKAQELYPDRKIFLVSVMLDRVKKEGNTQCVVRIFVGNENWGSGLAGYGQTMDAPKNGKVVKKYQRVRK